MGNHLPRTIADAYRWQRRLGNTQIESTHCHIVANRAYPDVWDSNHADEVTAQTEPEIDTVFAAMNEHLGHTPWR
jgi:glutathione S-transferase